MLHHIIRFTGEEFHLKKSELGINAVEFVDHRLHSLVFLWDK